MQEPIFSRQGPWRESQSTTFLPRGFLQGKPELGSEVDISSRQKKTIKDMLLSNPFYACWAKFATAVG